MDTTLTDTFDTEYFRSLSTFKNLARVISTTAAAGLGIYFVDRYIISSSFVPLRSVMNQWGEDQTKGWSYVQHMDDSVNHILQLPIALRSKIWSHLDLQELRTLRLVCGRLQCDVDLMVGIHVILDEESPYFQWIQHVAVQSCFVKTLTNSTWDMFSKPNLLRRMEISESNFVDSALLESIIDTFPHLEELILYMTSTGGEVKDGFSRNLAENYLSILNNGKLGGLKIEFIFESRSLRWIANFSKSPKACKKDKSCNKSDTQIRNIYLSLPVISPENRDFWINILNSQNSSKTLYINLGDVNWCLYKNIVKNNTNTLTKIFLSQICPNFYSESEPFDFAIFENCVFLKVLGISCESVGGSRRSLKNCIHTRVTNFHKLPHENLEGVLFTFLSFTLQDLELIDSMVWGSSIKRGILMNCAVEGIQIPPRVLKKFKINTLSQGFYPLLGESLEEDDHSCCYHEPEIAACYNVAESVTGCANVLQDLLAPVAFSVWLAFW